MDIGSILRSFQQAGMQQGLVKRWDGDCIWLRACLLYSHSSTPSPELQARPTLLWHETQTLFDDCLTLAAERVLTSAVAWCRRGEYLVQVVCIQHDGCNRAGWYCCASVVALAFPQSVEQKWWVSSKEACTLRRSWLFADWSLDPFRTVSLEQCPLREYAP